MTKIRTRFAPSPTGSMHIGNIRTGIYSYALARHFEGKFILRIEDTDKKRETLGGIESIKNLLKTFGLDWDEYYVQSERVSSGIYKIPALELVKQGHAFFCKCEAKNAKKEGFSKELRDPCRDKNYKEGAVKLKVPDSESISFRDFIVDKDISWDTSTVADTTLLKSDGFPTYHLGVVVDDHEMNISHVIRGHDWLPSTPIHLLIYKYLGLERPEIGHATDILDPKGGKLSKRKGSVSVEGMLSEGYLPEALLNFVILLGWAPKDNRELFTLEEFVKAFDIKGFQKSNPVFNQDKLDWFNGQYIRKLSIDELNAKFIVHSSSFKKLDKNKQLLITKLLQDRIKKISDFDDLAGFFFEEPKVDKNLLGKNYQKHLEVAMNVPPARWANVIKEKGFKTGEFFMDLRVAVTGKKFTPPINESIAILGKEETLTRLRHAISNF